MLTLNELRKIAKQSGARDIRNVEIDVILTLLLQLLGERGLLDQLAFKGGTMFRKMVFGSRGRLSTDLDFTCRSVISGDDLVLQLLEALHEPFLGLSFQLERDKDLYVTADGCAINPVCSHAGNPQGEKIKIQISQRELPILATAPQPQLKLDYFELLPFAPIDVPCLVLEEAIAEKIRAACQRSKIRDLHDLAEIAKRAWDRDLTRLLAVLKIWNGGGPGLNFDRFVGRIRNQEDYDISDLANLLRKDQKPDLDTLIEQVLKQFAFLAYLTPSEQVLANDALQHEQSQVDQLIAGLRGEVDS